MPGWLEDVITAMESLGGVADYESLYAEVRKVRSEPLPASWQAIVRQTIESHSSDSKVFKGQDLFFSVDGIGRGVWGLRDKKLQTPLPIDIKEPQAEYRTQIQTYRVLRDTVLARALKALHKNRCQMCGKSLPLADGKAYSEAHHIQPLGGPHYGPDVAENILVLCPNDHVLCDYGSVRLDLDALRKHPKHQIGSEYVGYHNETVFHG